MPSPAIVSHCPPRRPARIALALRVYVWLLSSLFAPGALAQNVDDGFMPTVDGQVKAR